jgi:hypothetical protein
MWVSDTPLPEFMNELGREGWELVSKTVEYESVQGYPVYELTFKRHIPD